MRTAILLVSLVALPAPAAATDVRDYIGQTLTDVRVEVGGASYEDPSVLQLIETRVGQPLTIQAVRESVDHLVGLGRFEDVRVYASAAPPPVDGVVVTWVLVPVQRIARVDVSGNAVFSGDLIRTEIADRVGAQPMTARVGDIVRALTTYYAERGYRRPIIEPRVMPGRAPELAVLDLRIEAGPRTAIGNVTLRNDTGAPAHQVLNELRLERGRPYDRPAIDERIQRYEDSLRDLGYYEAAVDLSVTFPEDATADLTVVVDRGPRVRVVFAGDALPENRRAALVPIRQERSVDLDLLEDASRNIEAYLRQQGYRDADAPYVREQRADELILTFTVTRGPMHRLTSVNIAGNAAIPLTDLLPLAGLQPGEPFSDARVASVASAMTELYRVRGFARATVKPDVVMPDTPAEASTEIPVAVRFVIAEGERTMVGAVTIDGTSDVPEPIVRDLLTLTEGRPYYRPQIDADRDAIERHYRNEGFQNVRVNPELSVEEEGRRVDVRWTIVEGPRAVVDRVMVSGNVRTSAELILREVVLRPGSPVGDEALLESQRRLATLGLFRRVRIVQLPHGGDVTRDILIEVEEAPVTTIAYGGGLEAGRRLRTGDQARVEERIDLAPRGFFQVSRRNLWGKNRSVSLFTRVSLRPRDPGIESSPEDTGGYGFNEYRVVGTFREPRLLNRAGDLQLTGFLEQAIRSSFNFARRGVRVDYGRRLTSQVTFTGRYALDRTRLFDVHISPEDQLPIDRLFPQVRLSTLTASILRDTRDDVIDPTRGAMLGADTTFALRSLGSEVGFAKTSVQGFVFRRLPGVNPWVFAAGMRLGAALGFARVLDDDTVVDDVPASERFFAGGDSTVRGFVLDRLGTRDTFNKDGFPAGGSGLAVMNLELRSPYWKGLGGVGFVDAGNVFRRAGDIRLADLRPAAGFGLRYRSPLGPLRFDLGFNLDRQMLPNGDRERGMVFHLSLGQAF